ncbi:MAG: helix-turn-helix transcriptional regulator [Pseudomonadota bacterium]
MPLNPCTIIQTIDYPIITVPIDFLVNWAFNGGHNVPSENIVKHFVAVAITFTQQISQFSPLLAQEDAVIENFVMDINDFDNLGKRVLSIRKQKNLKQKIFSELIGVTHSYLSVVEHDKQRPSLAFIMSVLKATKVNADWLLTGRGSMYPPIKTEKQEIKEINEDRVAYGADNSPRPDDLKNHWDKLNEDQKRILAGHAKEMVENNLMREFINKMTTSRTAETLQVPSSLETSSDN